MVSRVRVPPSLQDRSDVTVADRLVETAEDADATGLRGSPGILANGTDMFPCPSAPTLEQLRQALSIEHDITGAHPRD